jgi:hypothetical protein
MRRLKELMGLEPWRVGLLIADSSSHLDGAKQFRHGSVFPR